MEKRKIPTDIIFEDTGVGKLEKKIWQLDKKGIDKILTKYGIPSPSELGKANSYIQTTPGYKVAENREKNDIVIIPVGSTEFHGNHLPSGSDTFFVSQICEGVRRYTEKQGMPVSLASPISYGAHPWHHYGMPGNVIIGEKNLKNWMLDMMLGLWNNGFRKQIFVNNHGHFWVMESAVQEFMKEYQLPGVYRMLDWHKVSGKFFRTKERGGELNTDFVHADESETAIGLLLIPDMVNMKYAVDTQPKGYLPDGHLDKAVSGLGRPSNWSDGQGHMPIEIVSTPEGIVGKATLGDPENVKRPVAYFSEYLNLLVKEILEVFPSGKVPPVEEVTYRTEKEMKPYLLKPGSKGWKPVYGLFKKL